MILFEETGVIVDCNEIVAVMVKLTSRTLLGRAFEAGIGFNAP